MKQKLEEAKISEASQLGKIRIVDSAIPNYDETSPQKAFILILSEKHFTFLFKRNLNQKRWQYHCSHLLWEYSYGA